MIDLTISIIIDDDDDDNHDKGDRGEKTKKRKKETCYHLYTHRHRIYRKATNDMESVISIGNIVVKRANGTAWIV